MGLGANLCLYSAVLTPKLNPDSKAEAPLHNQCGFGLAEDGSGSGVTAAIRGLR